MLKALSAVSTLSLLMISAPALAQASSAPSQAAKADDQDRIVCERYEETGSRLATRRVCKTVREWEEERRAQRSDIERAQRNVGMDAGN